MEVMLDFEGCGAGCLLEGRNEAPVSPPRGQRADYKGELESGRKVRIVTVSEAAGSASYDEAVGDGYFCYVPV